jgi:hypothetical protein
LGLSLRDRKEGFHVADETDDHSNYADLDWTAEDGSFDWEAVLDYVDQEDRDDAFWDWFEDQYSS